MGNRERIALTLKATIDITNVAFGELAQPFRKVNERRALASVGTTEPNNGNFG